MNSVIFGGIFRSRTIFRRVSSFEGWHKGQTGESNRWVKPLRGRRAYRSALSPCRHAFQPRAARRLLRAHTLATPQLAAPRQAFRTGFAPALLDHWNVPEHQ